MVSETVATLGVLGRDPKLFVIAKIKKGNEGD